MAKFLRVCVTRTESTELYVSVPDGFNNGDLMGGKYQAEIGRIAAETTDSMDWDVSEWEDTVEVQSVADVEEDEAKQYMWGELKVRHA